MDGLNNASSALREIVKGRTDPILFWYRTYDNGTGGSRRVSIANMKRKLLGSAFLLLPLVAFSDDTFQKSMKEMESAERKHNQEASHQLVAFMPLGAMFPDPAQRALAKAAGLGDVKKVERLVQRGADVNARGARGATPLFWAMHNIHGFTKLLELGANPNVLFEDGGSVMGWSVTIEDDRFLKAALAHGGNPNLRPEPSGETPLFEASVNGNITAVDTLVDSGANINQTGSSGDTPAMGAARGMQYRAVYRLLEKGADFAAQSKSGDTLVDIVSGDVGHFQSDSDNAQWHSKVVKLLQSKGAWR